MKGLDVVPPERRPNPSECVAQGQQDGHGAGVIVRPGIHEAVAASQMVVVGHQDDPLGCGVNGREEGADEERQQGADPRFVAQGSGNGQELPHVVIPYFVN